MPHWSTSRHLADTAVDGSGLSKGLFGGSLQSEGAPGKQVFSVFAPYASLATSEPDNSRHAALSELPSTSNQQVSPSRAPLATS